MGIGLEWAAAWKPWEVRPIINSRRRRKEMNAEAARTRQRLRRWAFRWAREQKPFSPPATEVCGASDPAGLHRAEVPAAAGVAAPPRLRPGPAAPTDPFSRPPPAPRRWTPFPEEGAAVARPRARPRPPATWRQEASIPAEEKKKKKKVEGAWELWWRGVWGKGQWGKPRWAWNEKSLRRAGAGLEKVAALSLPECESPLRPGFGDGQERERAWQRNGLQTTAHTATEKESRGKRKAPPGLGVARWWDNNGLTRRVPPGRNCSSKPQGKLRLLTDGARLQRLQYPEVQAHRSPNAWHHRPLPHPGPFLCGMSSERMRQLNRAFGNYSSRNALGFGLPLWLSW